MIDIKSVCIIGSGASGLTSIKSTLECGGLLPYCFEKNSTFGGVWNNNSKTKIPWDSMVTAISHYTMTFSDFEHPRNQNLYLPQEKINQYLSNYCKHFNLEKYINFNCNVENVKQIENDRWFVQWFNYSKNCFESKEFDFLIVCGGMINTPKQFPMETLKLFTGGHIYSKDYNSPNYYNGKRVLVIGKSTSGTQIASEISNNGAKSVFIYGKSKMNEWGLAAHNWRIKNIINENGYENDMSDGYCGVPIDFFCYIRNEAYKIQKLPENEQNIELNKYFKKLSGNNCDVPEYQNDENNFDKPFNILFTGIDQSYFENINKGKIKVLSNHYKIQNSNEKTIEFKNEFDGSLLYEEFDEIIFATGYNLNFSFFDKEMISKLSFDPNDTYVPCLLYKYTFSPNVNNLGIVGAFGTPFYLHYELQSRWINYVFSGIIKLPSKEIMLNGVEQIKKIRHSKVKTTFPYKDYVIFCDELAKEINALPNFEKMKNDEPELYNWCWNYILCPASFRLSGPFSNPKQAKDTIKHYHEVSNKFLKKK